MSGVGSPVPGQHSPAQIIDLSLGKRFLLDRKTCALDDRQEKCLIPLHRLL
jgi:hypothetical protein